MRARSLGITAAACVVASGSFAIAQPKPQITAAPKVTPVLTGIAVPLVLKPDLIVCKFEPAKLTGADRQQLRFRVYNIGRAAAPYHLLWADIGEFKNKLPVPPLKPGEFNQWIYPNAAVGGAQTPYTFWVDKDLWVTESNENNNLLQGVVKMNASEAVPVCSDGKMH